MTHRVLPFGILLLLSAVPFACGGDEPKQEYPASSGGSSARGGASGAAGGGTAGSGGSSGAMAGTAGDMSMGGEGN